MTELCNPVQLLREAAPLLHLGRFGILDIAAPSSPQGLASVRQERRSMNEEGRGPGGLDSAHDWKPRRRFPWGRRPPYPRQEGGPQGPPPLTRRQSTWR